MSCVCVLDLTSGLLLALCPPTARCFFHSLDDLQERIAATAMLSPPPAPVALPVPMPVAPPPANGGATGMPEDAKRRKV